jgi:hypothetical protein
VVDPEPPRCNFCSKPKREVFRIIAGESANICNECVELCLEILCDVAQPWEVAKYLGGMVGRMDQTALTRILERSGSQGVYASAGLALRPNTCFYLGPFREPFNNIYANAIRTAVQRLGVSLSRADEIYGSRAIIQDIWEAIFSSEVIIAELTGRNPNVMYEVGLAHALGKQVIILTQTLDDVPFDLKHYRCIVYDPAPAGRRAMAAKLRGTIGALLNRGKLIDLPPRPPQ